MFPERQPDKTPSRLERLAEALRRAADNINAKLGRFLISVSSHLNNLYEKNDTLGNVCEIYCPLSGELEELPVSSVYIKSNVPYFFKLNAEKRTHGDETQSYRLYHVCELYDEEQGRLINRLVPIAVSENTAEELLRLGAIIVPLVNKELKVTNPELAELEILCRLANGYGDARPVFARIMEYERREQEGSNP